MDITRIAGGNRGYGVVADDPEARVLIIRPSVVYGPVGPPSTNIYRLIDAI